MTYTTCMSCQTLDVNWHVMSWINNTGRQCHESVCYTSCVQLAICTLLHTVLTANSVYTCTHCMQHETCIHCYILFPQWTANTLLRTVLTVCTLSCTVCNVNRVYTVTQCQYSELCIHCIHTEPCTHCHALYVFTVNHMYTDMYSEQYVLCAVLLCAVNRMYSAKYSELYVHCFVQWTICTLLCTVNSMYTITYCV